LLKQE
jgi:hypothetical protein